MLLKSDIFLSIQSGQFRFVFYSRCKPMAEGAQSPEQDPHLCRVYIALFTNPLESRCP